MVNESDFKTQKSNNKQWCAITNELLIEINKHIHTAQSVGPIACHLIRNVCVRQA